MLTVADAAAEAKFKRRQHGSKRAARGTEHDARPEVGSANVGLHGRRGRFFPVLANLREETRAWRALLAQNFIAAIAVIADSGATNEHLRPVFGLRQSRCQVKCADDAGVSYLHLLGIAPPSDDAFAREMDDGVEARNCLRRQGYGRIP